MNTKYIGIFGEIQGTKTLRERIGSYLRYWPVFLASFCIIVGAGIIYLRYATPKYLATTSVLIKSTDGSNPEPNDIVDAALSGKRDVNVQNEILQLSSASLMEKTVAENNLNISYSIIGRLHNSELYYESPFTLIPKQIIDSNHAFGFEVSEMNEAGGVLKNIDDESGKKVRFEWNLPMKVNGNTVVLKPNIGRVDNAGKYLAEWFPVSIAAATFSEGFEATPFAEKSSVISLSIKTKNLRLGADVLDLLFKQFNLLDIQDRNKLAINTVEFIDDRLSLISEELKDVEGSQENYQTKNELVDITGQSTQSLENANDETRLLNEVNVQLGIVDMIFSYFENPANAGKLVPSTLGLNDATLALLVNQYNELQLKKEREAPLLAPKSTIMLDLNSQLANLNSSITESLKNIKKNLTLRASGLKRQTSHSKNFLSTVPHNQRVMQEIRRKQTITEGLYLYLLQKREEAAISSTTANIPHYTQIDAAKGFGPIQPKRGSVLFFSALLSFFVAFGILYLRELLNDKVITKADVMQKLEIPIIAEISTMSKQSRSGVSVLADSLESEQFRTLRTNLSFSLNNSQPNVIMITSAISGEGKSIVSLNLAAAYSLIGRKVALLEFDVRKDMGGKVTLDSNYGITDFLRGSTSCLEDIAYPHPDIPNLDIYPSGYSKTNPTDLLQTDRLAILIKELRGNYDYIIIDTPPVSLFSDPFVFGKFSDLNLFIIRARKTNKRQLDLINQIDRSNKLTNLKIVLNGTAEIQNHDYNSYYGSRRKNKHNLVKS